MAFGSFNQQNGSGHTVSEINMIPLIDVMLVLLVIFMITAPMMTHAVKIDLPKANSQAQQATPTEPVNLSIDADGQLFWNQEAVSREQLQQKLALLGSEPDPAELHVRADRDAAYHFVAEALADAANAGVSRIGFVSEPEPM
ncbi:ExbD/TolR family protein [Methylomonas methanica]|uniref:Biopolymer transport protein ExbD/TolR n=1 Tax=Methylomonas methanica (strain DSM 25384 / MC09) TaxID=857087 RepID=G0A6B9_METMM|nr:biopolymer transporter ExbD [Methylomonas methanica]AEG01747.1 Biopolymer transport protein ExbD/TolR [Methylomonas methanica MC09]